MRPNHYPFGPMQNFDVVVVGGGNAALVAAIAARRDGANVLLLERATTWMRGGNSRHTRNTRCAHGDEIATRAHMSGAYSEQELLEDLLQVGGGPSANPDFTRVAVRESSSVIPWMSEQGVRWQRPLTGTLNLSRTNAFFLGGGKALVNTYYRAAEQMRIGIQYDAGVAELLLDGDRVDGVVVEDENSGERRTVRARAVVIACGGFEANLSWLREYWGEAANNYIIRGTPYNDGRVLRALLDAGAVPISDPRGFHAVAVDARAPKFDGGIATRLDSIPFGIVVDIHGKRFADEGANVWPKRYASWGTLIALQQDQIAYSLFDSRMLGQFMTSLYRPFTAPSIGELGAQLGLPPEAVIDTVDCFNRSITPGGTFDPNLLDDCSTTGLDPPKSHWAVPISEPPFYGYALRPGITFTYRGVAVDECARVQFASGPMRNLFAAGEIMSGNILRQGYLAGFGLTIGTVSGRLAGRTAARYARG
jgi:tricarballylate dehydrogenase